MAALPKAPRNKVTCDCSSRVTCSAIWLELAGLFVVPVFITVVWLKPNLLSSCGRPGIADTIDSDSGLRNGHAGGGYGIEFRFQVFKIQSEIQNVRVRNRRR